MHNSVMLNEVIKHLNIKSNGFYIDATFGAGGHSMKILKHLNFHGKITAFDKNIKLYKNIQEKKNINKFNTSFDSLPQLSKSINIQIYDGIIIDLGFSTNQIKNPQLGFSFKKSNFLDMRFNESQKIRVIDWINNANSFEMADVFSFFGDKNFAYDLTATILKFRQTKIIKTSNDITKILNKTQYNSSSQNKLFNLIRIFINNEMLHLKTLINNIIYTLKKNAIIILISFNSLEDKISKNYLINNNNINFCYKIKPLSTEINNNINARSAIMRIFKKI